MKCSASVMAHDSLPVQHAGLDLKMRLLRWLIVSYLTGLKFIDDGLGDPNAAVVR